MTNVLRLCWKVFHHLIGSRHTKLCQVRIFVENQKKKNMNSKHLCDTFYVCIVFVREKHCWHSQNYYFFFHSPSFFVFGQQHKLFVLNMICRMFAFSFILMRQIIKFNCCFLLLRLFYQYLRCTGIYIIIYY